MLTPEIRQTFLEFFRSRDHRVWPSASLIPQDPSLLLTVAGMVPFKPYFLGEAVPDHPRAASIQKVARTVDIDIIGTTTRHLTCFEMLGNFSFGDYFKPEAIAMAYELATQGFGMDPERIWVTVFEDDDEAEALWQSETDIPLARIQRIGVPEGATRKDASDNFWSTGGPGPCGPCSELYYDRGPDHGADGGPIVDETRFIEFWNLVFMQFEQDADGQVVGTLPTPSIDTGAGLERLSVLLQDVPNVFETDVIRPILDRGAEVTSSRYGDDDTRDVSLRVLADHARASAFLIADGVLPANEGRGYVLRRLLRRIVVHSRRLGHDGPIMRPMLESVIDTLGDFWTQLPAQRELLERVTVAEEEGFGRTLRSGMAMLDDAIAEARAADAEAPALAGQTAFTLHDTFGFPVDLTLEIAADAGVSLDRDDFAAHMDAQRTRARAARKSAVGDADAVPIDAYKRVAARTGPTTFTGYTDLAGTGTLGGILTPDGEVSRAQEGDLIHVVVDSTPFYAESGGQLGDHGTIATPTGRIAVTDTIRPVEGLWVHVGEVVAGEVEPGQPAETHIDEARRASIARGHTATHILHQTLKEVLGEHATQAGSAIDEGRFRFDFPHFDSVSPDALAQMEEVVNARIAADDAVSTQVTSQDDARAMGATALFGEKYGEIVRVVSIGDYSLELCGGTHVARTPEVGLFTVLTEGSISANVRRIEALTGTDAFGYLNRERMVANQVAQLLKVSSDEVPGRVAALMDRVRAAEKAAAAARADALLASGAALMADAEDVGGTRVIAAAVDGADRDGLKTLATDLRNRLGHSVVVLGSTTPEGTALLVAAVSGDVVAAGTQAADVLRPAAQAVGGGAGGRGDVAQAGGKDGSRLAEAIAAGRDAARAAVGG